MNNERNLFLYWVGKEYKLITILRKLIYLHSTNGKGYNVILITEKNICDYIKNIPSYFDKLCCAHQADFVRVNIICDYGGIWLDSDTLVIESLDSLFDNIDNQNGFFIKENSSYLCNGIFGSKKQTHLMIEWKKQMLITLDLKKENIEWCEIGNNILEKIKKQNYELYNDYKIFNGLDNLYPINWNMCVSEFIDKPYENYKNIMRNYQPLVVLVNSVYKKLENKSEQEILDSNIPLNYFINKSLDNLGASKNKLYSETNNKTIFENIYKNKIWNNGNNNIPLSGPGSSIENTKECSKQLNDFIYNNDCKSVLDLGCGDLTWISKTHFFNDNNIKYIGIDVVENLINDHLYKYPEKQFYCKDITMYNDIEFTSIIIIRDVIFHLTNSEILSIFNNIKNKFKYILITSCKNDTNHDNFDRWHFSQKNINTAPFNVLYNFEIKIQEDSFNRNVYIYKHDNFYN
jgi:hypothetical protein